jgi:hypothetical protein
MARREIRPDRRWRFACLVALLACCQGTARHPVAGAVAGARSPAGRLQDQPRLGVSGSRFTIDGRPRFLLGVSLFDALGPKPPRDTDLDALRQWGITAVRVWAHWSRPLCNADGSVPPAGRSRLTALADRLQARGLVLELVLFRPGELPGQAYAAFSSAAARVRAARELARAMKPYRLAFFDLYNEHDHRDGPISHPNARALRDAVKAIDPARLVTISSSEYHFFRPPDGLDAEGRANVLAETSAEPGAVAVDILSAHLPRTADWAARTGARVRALLAARSGAAMPVYLNEENRAEEGRPATAAAQYLEAARAASEAGAAGWVFHTGAGYALDRQSFLDALNAEERRALQSLAAAVGREP